MGINMQNVSFSYENKQVLCKLDLTIHSGEHTGIMGTSGEGKSTLLKLLSGLYATQTGSLEVEGEKNPLKIRQYTEIVMQSAMLLPASIKENITCGHPMDEERIRQTCESAQLSHWLSTLPDGWDTFVGEPGTKISGGQAQRIAIARATAKQTPIILLDEATSALDKETGSSLLLALEHLTKTKTVISVSHHLETLKNCNQIYRLERGRLQHV